MIEQKRRSILKAISWRITGTLSTVFVSFLITGTLDVAIKIGAVELFAKFLLQYWHERAWTRVKFGLVPADYQI